MLRSNLSKSYTVLLCHSNDCVYMTRYKLLVGVVVDMSHNTTDDLCQTF